MTLARVLPSFAVAAFGVALASGCHVLPFDKRPFPNKDGEIIDRLEATQPAGEKLPEIVSLPATGSGGTAMLPAMPAAPPQPAYAPLPTTARAGARPEGTYRRPEPVEEDVYGPPAPRRTTRPPAVAARPQGGGKTYTIQRGDTLQKISQKLYGTSKNWMRIYEANKGKIKKPDVIVVGTTIRIP